MTDTATVPVVRFPNSGHAERMVSHLERQIERAEQSAAALRQFSGYRGDIYLTSTSNAPYKHDVGLHAGNGAATSARWCAEDYDDEGELADRPKPDFNGCIVLHPDGTWGPVELFPEHQP